MERQETEALAAPADQQPSSCDVSDACDLLGIGVARTGLLRPLWPACPRLAGSLATVRLEPAEAAPTPQPELLEVLALGAELKASEREQLQAVTAGADPRAVFCGSSGTRAPGQGE